MGQSLRSLLGQTKGGDVGQAKLLYSRSQQYFSSRFVSLVHFHRYLPQLITCCRFFSLLPYSNVRYCYSSALAVELCYVAA